MRPDVLSDIPMNDRQVQTFLQCSTSSWFRWLKCGFPHPQRVILRSLATGLPVSVANSSMWPDYRFDVHGILRTPTDYPIGPYDLWVYELLQLNGLIFKACDREGIERPENPALRVVGGAA